MGINILETPISRRAAIAATGASAVGIALAPFSASAAPEARPLDSAAGPEVTNRIRSVAERKYTVDQLGFRVTNAWKAPDGFNMLGYQGVLLQEDPTSGEVRLWNTLDEMNKAGLDAKLDNGSLGVRVPPYQQVDDKSGGDIEVAYRNRVAMFNVPADVVAFANDYRRNGLEVGVFTSRGESYGNYEVWRMQRIAVQRWKDGLIQRVLVGDAAKKAGIVPAEVQTGADLNFGKFDSQPPIPQPAPAEAPKSTPAIPSYPGGDRFENDPKAREEELNKLSWGFYEGHTQTEHSLAMGKLVSSRKEGNKITITVATNKNDPNEKHEVVIDPSRYGGLRFLNPEPNPFYETSDPEAGYQTIKRYMQDGDPIFVLVITRGELPPSSPNKDKFAAQNIIVFG